MSTMFAQKKRTQKQLALLISAIIIIAGVLPPLGEAAVIGSENSAYTIEIIDPAGAENAPGEEGRTEERTTEEGTTEEGTETEETETEETETETEETETEETETETEETETEEIETEEETETEEEETEETETEETEETETEESTTRQADMDEMAADLAAALSELQRAETAAKEGLAEILEEKTVFAVLYLTDAYALKAEAANEAGSVASLHSGQTVEISDVELTDGKFWYAVTVHLAAGEDTFITHQGYIESQHLAYADELILTWEDAYLVPWFTAMLEYEKQLASWEACLSELSALAKEGEETDGTKEPDPLYGMLLFDSFLTEEEAVNLSIEDSGLMSMAHIGVNSEDVDRFPPSYRDSLNALKKKYPNWVFVPVNTYHTWTRAVDGQLSPPQRSLVYSTARSSWKGKKYSGDWFLATRTAVEYLMDPRNNLTERLVFQFEQLTYNDSVHKNEQAMNNVLSSTFMNASKPIPGDTRTYSRAFLDIGATPEVRVSPYHLAARVRQEQGANGTSPLISGTYPGYHGYYNYFNIGASGSNDTEVIVNGLKYAQSRGWDTRYKSLDGGARFIGNDYIKQGQDTLYLAKFNVAMGNMGRYDHQYMQNVQAPQSEAGMVYNFYSAGGAVSSPFVFKIPVYEGMPAGPAPLDPIILASSVTIDKEKYNVVKGEPLTLFATVLPANTTNKSVTWTSNKPDIISINKDTGRINTDKVVTVGETAVITVRTLDGSNKVDTTEVTVINGVSTFVWDAPPTFEMTVNDTKQLTAEAHSIFHPTEKMRINWQSSDPAVASVTNISDDGEVMVTALKTGQAVITARVDDWTEWELTCVVNVRMSKEEDEAPVFPDESLYPLPQNNRYKADKSVVNIESHAVDNDSQASIEIRDQFGNSLTDGDINKFDFRANRDGRLLFDVAESPLADTLIIKPDPRFEPKSKTKVSVTATLREDPLKRKFSFSVNVVPKAQTKSLELWLEGSPLAVEEPVSAYHNPANPMTYNVRAVSNDAAPLQKVKWSVSDSSVARLRKGADNTVSVTIKKAGSFRLTCQVQDNFKTTQSVTINAISSAPQPVSKNIVFNKQRSGEIVVSDPFTLLEMFGCEIVPEDFAAISLTRGKNDFSPVADTMTLEPINEDGLYQLTMPWSLLNQRLSNGKYNLKVNITTLGSPLLSDKESKRLNELAFTLQVVDKNPISFNRITINNQLMDESMNVLTVKGNARINGIHPVQNQKNDFDLFFRFVEITETMGEQAVGTGIWRVVLTERGRQLSPRTVTGVVDVSMAGFRGEQVKLSVKLVNQKPAIVPDRIPQLQSQGARDINETIWLTDKKTKERIVAYDVHERNSGHDLVIKTQADGSLNVELSDSAKSPNKKFKNGQTLTATLRIIPYEDVNKKIWRDPVDVRVSMRIFNDAPTARFGTTSFTLNRNAPADSAVTTLTTNRDNEAFLTMDGWRIMWQRSGSQYVLVDENNPIRFNYNRAAGLLTLSINPDNVPGPGTYRYRISGFLDNFPATSRDLTVRVVERYAAPAISVSGRMDLLRRHQATMQGLPKLSSMSTQLTAISLLDGADDSKNNDSYYAMLRPDNRFDIRLRTGGLAYAKSTTIPVRLHLRGGSHVDTSMRVKPTQSTPKITRPALRTMYRGSGQVEEIYNLNELIKPESGYVLANARLSQAPAGFAIGIAKNSNGELEATVQADSERLKRGTYNIRLNLYFQGAQPLRGNPEGKPVVVTLRVKVL